MSCPCILGSSVRVIRRSMNDESSWKSPRLATVDATLMAGEKGAMTTTSFSGSYEGGRLGDGVAIVMVIWIGRGTSLMRTGPCALAVVRVEGAGEGGSGLTLCPIWRTVAGGFMVVGGCLGGGRTVRTSSPSSGKTSRGRSISLGRRLWWGSARYASGREERGAGATEGWRVLNGEGL